MTSSTRGTGPALAVVMLLIVACSSQRSGAPDSPGTGNTQSSIASDSATLARLEREARALARTDGCTASGECRTAPVGNRPCGGPRDYVAYCARTTDSVALFRKLDSLKAAETEYNRRQGLASTCEFRMPPNVGLVGGSCRAVGQ